jgi:hypothetical protein
LAIIAAAAEDRSRCASGPDAEPGRLDAVLEVLDKLAAADREIIEPALQPWARRASCLGQRDAAVRTLVADHYLDCGSGRGAAAACARDLRRYACSAWRFEQEKPPDGDGKRRLMHEILGLNRGKALSAGQIRTVLAGLR